MRLKLGTGKFRFRVNVMSGMTLDKLFSFCFVFPLSFFSSKMEVVLLLQKLAENIYRKHPSLHLAHRKC